MLAHVLLAFLFLQLPQNDTIPHGVARHTPLGAGLLRNYSFCLHHSGFDDHNMGRLKKVKYNFKKCRRIKGKHFSWHFLENQFNKKQKEKKFLECLGLLDRKVLHNLSFYWHHSGFYNDSKDRLHSDNCKRTEIMKINVSRFSLTSYNSGSLPKRQT